MIARDVMTRDVVSVTPDTPVRKIASILVKTVSVRSLSSTETACRSVLSANAFLSVAKRPSGKRDRIGG
jgi:CBS domain-containing protein